MSLLLVSVFDHHQGACTEPGESYIYAKTFGEITSLSVMRWCGSMLLNGVCAVCCAECDSVAVAARYAGRAVPARPANRTAPYRA